MCLLAKILLPKLNKAIAYSQLSPLILNEIGGKVLSHHILRSRMHSESIISRNSVVLGHDIGDDG